MARNTTPDRIRNSFEKTAADFYRIITSSEELKNINNKTDALKDAASFIANHSEDDLVSKRIPAIYITG